MLEVGKLYACEEYYLILYPDPETGVVAETLLHKLRARSRQVAWKYASGEAAYWSKRLGKPVSYVDKNIPFLVLNNEEEYIEVLAGDRKGWIIYLDWLELKEFC